VAQLQSEEEKRGGQPVTVISYEFWQSRFGGNEAALNQQISLNGKAHTIIGILLPALSFAFGQRPVGLDRSPVKAETFRTLALMCCWP
jgi:hypothetical protein